MPRKKVNTTLAVSEHIHEVIHIIRGERVILDADLAKLYGVETRVLLQQLRRNAGKFPSDFLYVLTKKELTVLRSQNVISSSHGGRRTAPVAFTEHGAIMAATILNSEEAVAMSIFVVRAFIKMRQVLAETKELARKLEELEARISDRMDGHEETFEIILNDLHTLLSPPPPAKSRRIGFMVEGE